MHACPRIKLPLGNPLALLPCHLQTYIPFWLTRSRYRTCGRPRSLADNKSGIFSTELFTEAAIEAIEAHPSDKSAFIYIAYTAPHTPVQAPAEFIARTDAVYEDLPNRRTIAAMMADVDHAIGRVQASLEQRDMWKDTVTVILSDNGGTAGRETDPGVYSPPLDEMVHSNCQSR